MIIQKNKIQISSEWQASLKKELFHIAEEENRTWFSETEMWFIRLISVIAVESLTSIHISYLGQVIIYCFSWNISSIHYLLHILSRIFRQNMTLIKTLFVVIGWPMTFIFQVKISTSKSFKPIADNRNSCSTTPVNNRNIVCNIICTICILF